MSISIAARDDFGTFIFHKSPGLWIVFYNGHIMTVTREAAKALHIYHGFERAPLPYARREGGPMTKDLLTTAEAAARLGLRPVTIRAAYKRGAITPALVVGEGRRATFYYEPEEVDRYGRERQVGWVKGRPRK